ncbi:MAG TPA: hypothetical protein VI431_09770 [Candidatus Acidoferrum sp.]
MEINLDFVLFEELKEKPDGSGVETRIVIIRESKDVDSALNPAASDSYSPE